MAKKRKSNTPLLIGISVILIIIVIFGVSQSFLQFDFEKNVKFNSIDAISKSTNPYGTDSQTTIRTACNDARLTRTQTNTVPDNAFTIDLTSRSSINQVGCGDGPAFSSIDTFIQTSNLNISSNILKSLSITFSQKSIFGCIDPQISASGGNSRIELVGAKTIPLYVSRSAINKRLSETSEAGTISITKTGGIFILKGLNDSKEIAIPSGNYELKIYSDINGNQCPGGASEKIGILSIEKTEREVVLETTPEIPFIECVSNVDCSSKCGSQVPTCVTGSCLCTEDVPTDEEISEIRESLEPKTNILIFIIPVLVFVLIVGLIFNIVRKKRK